MHRTVRLAALLAWPLLAAGTAGATPYTVSGTVDFVAAGSNVGNATGQAIRDALNGLAATLTLDVDTSVADTDPLANAIELRGAVTSSSASIGGFSFSAGSNTCLDPAIDCRATAVLDAFSTTIDLQSLTSGLLQDAALPGSLSFLLATSGTGLFATPQIVDPNSGTLDARVSVFYVTDLGVQVVRFRLLPDSASVPAPGTLALSALGLGLAGWLRRRR